MSEQTAGGLQLEFAGEWFRLEPDGEFVIGRSGQLDLDDNRFLHRHFLKITHSDGFWWLANVGSRLSATVSSGGGTVQSWLSPGARIPIVFSECVVVFTAGPTTYEIVLVLDESKFAVVGPASAGSGDTTVMPGTFTPSQRLVIIALAEPLLRRDAVSVSEIPSSGEAARRLGWTNTKFNRKLDNVCDKLDQAGVPGLRAGGGKVAANRRARLVEYAVSSNLVTRADLELLENPAAYESDEL